jgi:hypothetical protein
MNRERAVILSHPVHPVAVLARTKSRDEVRRRAGRLEPLLVPSPWPIFGRLGDVVFLPILMFLSVLRRNSLFFAVDTLTVRLTSGVPRPHRHQ